LKFKFGGAKKKNTWSMIAAAVAGASVAAKAKEEKPAETAKTAVGEGSGDAEQPRNAEPTHKSKPEVQVASKPEIGAAVVLEAKSTPEPLPEPAAETTRDIVPDPAQGQVNREPEPMSGPQPESKPTVPSSPSRRSIALDLDDEPPQVGPKPPSPRTTKMPGAFGDDLDFPATLAAGLASTGFDPNMVIDDPTYRRRDSPPGSNEPYYVPPSAETVTDLGLAEPEPTPVMVTADPPRELPEQRSPMGDWETSFPSSRKGRRKRQSVDVDVLPEAEPQAVEEHRSAGPTETGQDRRDERAEQPVSIDTEKTVSTGDVFEVEKDDPFVVDADEESTKSSKKAKRKSKRDSASNESTTYSTPSSEVSIASSSSRKSKKNRRKSVKDDNNIPEQDEPPDRPGDSFQFIEREVSSVVSDPIGKRSGDHTKHGEETKSVVSLPTNGTNGHKESSITENGDKGNSFLGNAGTFGAGAGLAGAAAAIAAQFSRPNAAQDFVGEEPLRLERSVSYSSQIIDPEIVPREIKPAIDPQYGDLLPLPPSEPGSPSFDLEEEFPPLPESRPDTPPESRSRRATMTHTRRRSAFETPIKTPSRTAVPVQFLIGRGSVPSSPAFRSSPLQSPVAPAPETPPKNRTRRPTSWEGREIRPLYLIEKAGSSAHHAEEPQVYPELPPSEPPSRESPGPEFDSRETDVDYLSRGVTTSTALLDLHVDTALTSQDRFGEPLGSGETTPRAFVPAPEDASPFAALQEATLPQSLELDSEPLDEWQFVEDLEVLPPLPDSPPESPTVAEVPAAVGLVEHDELEHLPPLPESRPVSPVQVEVAPVAAIQLPLVDELEHLPPLLDSRPVSPVQAEVAPAAIQFPLVDELEHLPPLPDSRPASPVQVEVAPVVALDSSSGCIDAGQNIPLQHYGLDLNLETLPPLPESRPSSPIEGATPRSTDVELLSATLYPAGPGTETAASVRERDPDRELESLPPLPESRPSSPEQQPVDLTPVLAVESWPNADLSDNVSADATAQMRQREDLETLPPLPESRPGSPTELSSPELAVPERPATVVVPIEQEEAPVLDLESLPPLPASHPSSPAHVPSSLLLGQEPPLSQAHPMVQEVDRSLDLEKLPALPDSRPGSPTLLPAFQPSSEPISVTELTLDLEKLPALPESRPDSPTQLPPPSPTSKSLPATASTVPVAGDESGVEQPAAMEERDSAEFSSHQIPSDQLPATYEELKHSGFQKRALSSPPRHSLEKEGALEAADKTEHTLLSSAAAASAATASGIVVAHMRHEEFPRPEMHHMDFDNKMDMPSHERAESVYSFNEDASTVAASEAPTFMSGSTFYETQQEPVESVQRPEALSFLFGKRAQKASVQEDDSAAVSDPASSKKGKNKSKGSQRSGIETGAHLERDLEPETQTTEDAQVAQLQEDPNRPAAQADQKPEDALPKLELSGSVSAKGKRKKKGKKEVSWIDPEPETTQAPSRAGDAPSGHTVSHNMSEIPGNPLTGLPIAKTTTPVISDVSTAEHDMATNEEVQLPTAEHPTVDSTGSDAQPEDLVIEAPETAAPAASGKKNKEKGKTKKSSARREEPGMGAEFTGRDSIAGDVAESSTADNDADLTPGPYLTPPLHAAAAEASGITEPRELPAAEEGLASGGEPVQGMLAESAEVTAAAEIDLSQEEPDSAATAASSITADVSVNVNADADANVEEQRGQKGSEHETKRKGIIASIAGGLGSFLGIGKRDSLREEQESQDSASRNANMKPVQGAENENTAPTVSSEPDEAEPRQRSVEPLEVPNPPPQPSILGDSSSVHEPTMTDKSVDDTASSTLDTAVSPPNEQAPAPDPVGLTMSRSTPSDDAPIEAIAGRKDQPLATQEGERPDEVALQSPDRYVQSVTGLEETPQQQEQEQQQPLDASIVDVAGETIDAMGKKGKKPQQRQDTATTTTTNVAQDGPASEVTTPTTLLPSIVDKAGEQETGHDLQQQSTSNDVTEVVPSEAASDALSAEPASGKKNKKKKKKKGGQDVADSLGEDGAEKDVLEAVEEPKAEPAPEQSGQTISEHRGEDVAEKVVPQAVEEPKVEPDQEQIPPAEPAQIEQEGTEPSQDVAQAGPSDTGKKGKKKKKKSKEAALPVQDLTPPAQESEQTPAPVENEPEEPKSVATEPETQQSSSSQQAEVSAGGEAEAGLEIDSSSGAEKGTEETKEISLPADQPPIPPSEPVSQDQESDDAPGNAQRKREKKKKRQTVTFAEPLEEQLGSSQPSSLRGEDNKQLSNDSKDTLESSSQEGSMQEQLPRPEAQIFTVQVGDIAPQSGV
jgi:hypothetical protein